jgi:hypothetical protein
MHSLHVLITPVHDWQGRILAGFLSGRTVTLQKTLEIFRYTEKL